MAKARILAVVVIGVLLLSALAPGIASSAVPTVANYAPYNGATDIMLMPTLECTYTANPDAQGAARWQISTNDNFTDLVWDTGIMPETTVTLDIPRGYLLPETTYYWRVMAQDVLGYWSAWSADWSFTTAASFRPDQPENLSPANGTTEISPDMSLQSSAFYDGDGDGHYGSRWQVAALATNQKNADGSYQQPLYDSSVTTSNKEQIALPVGLVDYGRSYCWHVMYYDDRGAWSAWSEETSFTVVKNVPPGTPRNVTPADQATGVSTKPVLQASDFSDPDATAYIGLTDSHGASQWQIRTSTGDYTSPKWNKVVTGAATSVAVPDEAEILAGTQYYWHVRYQDSVGNWSGYSAETSFTTKGIAVPVASFSADKTEVVIDRDLVTFTDNSTPMGEIARWEWDFGDGTTESWTGDTRPPNGKVSHKYTGLPASGNTYTVMLTVYNGAAPQGVVKTLEIVVHQKPAASFTSSPAAPKAGKQITFTDTTSSPDDVASWEWQFDDGTTETWTTRPANGQITHTFKKGGEHTVSLIVKGKGDLGESIYNKKVIVKDAGGFKFGLWMVFVGVAVVVVVAGVVYLVRARRATAK